MSLNSRISLFVGLILLGLILGGMGLFVGAGRLGIVIYFLVIVFVLVQVASIFWAVFTFYHYRYIRQEELLHVLKTATESQAPLAPALWAYVGDRPHSTWREFLVSMMLFPVYYWSWHRWYSYDRKVEQLALILEGGAPLHLALHAVPGVASKEITLASAIGQASGQMASCLSEVPRWQLASLWLDVIPRLLYPVILLFVASGLMIFQMLFVVPRFEKIFADLKVKLPELTEQYISFGRWVGRYGGVFGLIVLILFALFGLILFNSKVCWHFPVVGRIYRLRLQAGILKGLAILMKTGKPTPQAMDLLIESGYFPSVVCLKLEAVRKAIDQGQPLPENLCQNGLLPQSMVPLLQAAGRADNLPWALGELGESQAKRAVRLARRLVMAIFPISIMAIGLAVAAIALGMFLPLVELISELPV